MGASHGQLALHVEKTGFVGPGNNLVSIPLFTTQTKSQCKRNRLGTGWRTYLCHRVLVPQKVELTLTG
jgi:hypothetical protein